VPVRGATPGQAPDGGAGQALDLALPADEDSEAAPALATPAGGDAGPGPAGWDEACDQYFANPGAADEIPAHAPGAPAAPAGQPAAGLGSPSLAALALVLGAYGVSPRPDEREQRPRR
jgi:hypothetical protein